MTNTPANEARGTGDGDGLIHPVGANSFAMGMPVKTIAAEAAPTGCAARIISFSAAACRSEFIRD
jgi:uncharacterized membrane protein